MEIAPAGTVDPTSSLYNTTMYAMAALLGIALIANKMIRPIDDKHYMETQESGSGAKAASEA